MIRKFLKKVGHIAKSQLKRIAPSPASQKASFNVISRSQHSISRREISENALKVLYKLHKAGFAAHLVGGGVRDLLLGLHPKDFDVATSATPEQVRRLFRNSRIIGRRFKLVHVYFGYDLIEVATFRAGQVVGQEAGLHPEHGMIIADNIFGNIEEDAFRRDFTVNALYYNIADYSIVDYTNGMQDIQDRVLRMIGDPEKRFREDPVRILRALRLACKLNFSLAPDLIAPIQSMKGLLKNVPAARLFEEVLKLFHGGSALPTYQLLKEKGVFQYLFPQTAELLENTETAEYPIDKLLQLAFEDTDSRIQEDKHVTPAFLLAVLLWYPVSAERIALEAQGERPFVAMHEAIDNVLREQNKTVSIPKRISLYMRDIWILQLRLEQVSSRNVFKLFTDPHFRAAYDFLMVRSRATENNQKNNNVNDKARFWTDFVAGDENQRIKLIKKLTQTSRQGAPVKKRRSKKKNEGSIE